MDWLNVQQVQQILGIGKTTVYNLSKDKRLKQILGQDLIVEKNPLRISKEQIEKLVPYFKDNPGITKVISIINHKGGVAKTTSALNISNILADKGFKVLLVDLDPQANSSDILSVDIKGKDIDFGEKNLYSAFKNIFTFKEVIHPTRIENLYLIPSDIGIGELEISENISLSYFDEQFKTLPIYDYIVFDTPPSMGIFTKLSLTASTDVLIPMHADYFSIKGLQVIRQMISLVKSRNPDLNEIGAFMTMYEKNTQVAKIITKGIQDLVNSMKTTIPKSTDVQKAYIDSKIMYEDNPKHIVSKSYVKLVKEAFDV